jgi:hypothetical protein
VKGLPSLGDRHFRRDCRDLVQILQVQQEDGSTVYKKEEIVALLRAAVKLGAEAANEGRVRDYRSAMWVIFESAKVEQRSLPREHIHAHAHLHAEADVDQLIELMESEVRARGLVVDESGNGNGAEPAPEC